MSKDLTHAITWDGNCGTYTYWKDIKYHIQIEPSVNSHNNSFIFRSKTEEKMISKMIKSKDIWDPFDKCSLW
jgi:hypothetical protein